MKSRTQKAVLSLLDVGFSSVSTMIFTVIAARSVDVQGFGVFGVLFACATALQSIVQGGYIDVVLKSQNSANASFWIADRFFLVLLLLGATPFFASIAFGDAGPVSFVVGIIGAAGLYVRHSWVRAFYHVRNRRLRSVVVSFASATISAGCLLLWVLSDIEGWSALVVAISLSYGIPGGASAWDIFASRRAGSDEVRKLWRWDYAAESAILVSSVQVSSVLVTPALGLTFSAGFRGGNLLLGPLSMFFASLRLILLPAFSRRVGSTNVVVLAALVTGWATAVWCAIGAWVLANAGAALLGNSVHSTADIYWWLAGSYLSQGVYLVLFLAGRAWGMDREVRVVRTVQIILLFSGIGMAVIFGSAEFYFLGTIAGNVIGGFGLLFAMLRR